jgi:tryptophanyl-tRNA synthetase
VNSFLKEHQEAKKKAEKSVESFMYKGKLAKTMWERTYE